MRNRGRQRQQTESTIPNTDDMAIPACTLLLLLLVAVTASASPLNSSGTSINWTDFKSVNVNIKPLVPVKGLSTRIVGGKAAARGQFPWQAALFIDGRSFCGGSLISSTVVLTAAHCTITAKSVTVYLGALDVSQGLDSIRQSFQSTSIYNHPQYSSLNRNIDYDIAVVRLPSPATYNTYVSPVQLAASTSGLFEGARARTSGWGKISDTSSSISSTLNYVDLTVITNTVCAKSFGSAINSAKICVSTVGGVSTCNGDSGGPLVKQDSQGRYVQIGVTSFGSGRGCAVGAPAVFTRVSSYVDNFIKQHV